MNRWALRRFAANFAAEIICFHLAFRVQGSAGIGAGGFFFRAVADLAAPRFRSMYTALPIFDVYRLIFVACECIGGFVGTKWKFAVEELFVRFIGAVESGVRGGVGPFQVFQRGGGFVGTKCFVQCVFHLGADVNGGGEFLQDGFFGGCLWAAAGAEAVCNLGDGLVVFGR